MKELRSTMAWARSVCNHIPKTRYAHFREYGSLPDQTVYRNMLLRYATSSDIPGIINMSKQAHKDWYPSDYLPGWLPRSVQDPNRLTCVAEKDDQIMGYFQSARADNGDTILLEAGRCHPDIEGLGLLGGMMAWVVSRMSRTLCPTWKSSRGSSIQTHYYDRHHEKVNILTKRSYLRMILPSTAKIRERLGSLHFTKSTPLSKLSDDQFKDILSDTLLSKKLYPNDLISVGYNMFMPLPSNVQHIVFFHNNVLVTEDLSDGISIGGRIPCHDHRGWRYNFNYSGRADIETLLCHLVEHLEICVSEPPEKEEIHLVLLIPKSFVNMFGAKLLFITIQNLLGVPQECMKLFTQYQFEYI